MRNMQRPSEACFEAMWNDGKCDANCNNLACGFNDCSPSQSIVGCMAAQEEMGMDLSVAPDDPTIGLTLRITNPSISMDSARNKIVFKATVDYLIQWSDPRLPQSPCFDVLGILLSRRASEPIGNRAKFWVPDLSAVNGIDGANDDVGSSQVSVREATTVAILPSAVAGGAGRRLASALPLRTANLNATSTRLQKFEQQFDFTFYPFDDQKLVLDFSSGGTGAILDCEEIARQLESLPAGSLVPATSSAWALNGAPVATPMGGRANATVRGASRCQIEVPVARNAIVFIVQRLIPLLVMGGSALMVLNIDPSAAPAPGARIGALLSTMVLISLKGNGDLGLGQLTSLIWIDYLKIVQFLILLTAVLETSLVHHQIREGKKADAQRIDKICRIFMPLILYPYLVGCMLLVGMKYVLTGLYVLVVGVMLLFGYIFWLFKKGQRQRQQQRKRIVSAVGAMANPTDEANLPMLEEAFAFFDVDNSGSIDAQELHRCMRMLYPKMTRLQVSKAVKAMDLSFPVIFEDFAEALSHVQARADSWGGGAAGGVLDKEKGGGAKQGEDTKSLLAAEEDGDEDEDEALLAAAAETLLNDSDSPSPYKDSANKDPVSRAEEGNAMRAGAMAEQVGSHNRAPAYAPQPAQQQQQQPNTGTVWPSPAAAAALRQKLRNLGASHSPLPSQTPSPLKLASNDGSGGGASPFHGLQLAVSRPVVTLGASGTTVLGAGGSGGLAGGKPALSASMTTEQSEALRARILGMWSSQGGGVPGGGGGGLTHAALLARAQGASSGGGSESERFRSTTSLGGSASFLGRPGSESYR